jgi:hypothetical protein
MSNAVKYSIEGDTNAEQVTGRVQKAMGAMEKNIQGVEQRFKNFGKDLFLSFAAPMVLLNQAISAISASIEKNRQAVQDALRDAEKGENKYLRAGTVTSAREVSRRRQDALDRKNAELAAEALAEEQGKEGGVLGFGGEADKALIQYASEGKGFWDKVGRSANAAGMFLGINSWTKDKGMQDVLERRSAGRVAADPEQIAIAKQKEAAEAQLAQQKALDQLPKSFKGPEGFSNVVGVGANPVMEAMAEQTEIARQQLAALQQIAFGRQSTPVDFTKTDPHRDGYGDQM